MAASFDFLLIRLGLVSLILWRRETAVEVVLTYSPRERVDFVYTQFSLRCYFSPSLCVTHTPRHMYKQLYL